MNWLEVILILVIIVLAWNNYRLIGKVQKNIDSMNKILSPKHSDNGDGKT